MQHGNPHNMVSMRNENLSLIQSRENVAELHVTMELHNRAPYRQTEVALLYDLPPPPSGDHRPAGCRTDRGRFDGGVLQAVSLVTYHQVKRTLLQVRQTADGHFI